MGIFLKTDMRMVDRYMKRCSVSLVLREIQTKTRWAIQFSSVKLLSHVQLFVMNYYLTPIGISVLKKQEITKVDKELEIREPLCTVGGNVYWCSQYGKQYVSQSVSLVTQSCPTICDPINCSKPGLPVHHQLPKFTQTHVHRVSDAIQPSHPLSSPFPPAPNTSQYQSIPMSQLFTWGGQSIGVSALASVFQMNTQGWSPSEWTGWISLQSKGLKSLLQHHSSKASILWLSAFFTVQLSHPYMTTGKTIALTRWTYVGKVMSLLLNMLSRLVITFLPRSKHLLISWLHSPSAVILEPPK